MHELIVHTIPYFLLVLGVVVFIHEWGHYAVARLCGVRIESFSIGFGPELFGFHDGAGTRWKISLLPLGGYVKMFGDADEASNPREDVPLMNAEERKVAFFYKKVWQRALIVAAGPGINFLFTFIVFVGLFTTQGQPFTPPRVGAVNEGSPAAAAGIVPGDVIVKIGDEAIDRFEDVRRVVTTSATDSLPFTIQRNGETQVVQVHPAETSLTDRFGMEHKVYQVGVRSETGETEYKKYAFVPAIGASLNEMGHMITGTIQSLGQIIAGTRGTEELGGPLRIAQMSGKAGAEGFVSLIWFMGVISLSLGLFNLFPIPLLDGGHLLFYGIEAVKGKPLNESMMEFTSRVGFAFIIAMMLFSTWNDLVQLHIVSRIASIFS